MGLKRLRNNMSALTSLNLEECSMITKVGLEELKRVSTLKSLNLLGCSLIRDAELKELGQMSNFTSLYLGNHEDADEVTENGLKHLKHMPNLTYLPQPGRMLQHHEHEVAGMPSLPSA